MSLWLGCIAARLHRSALCYHVPGALQRDSAAAEARRRPSIACTYRSNITPLQMARKKHYTPFESAVEVYEHIMRASTDSAAHAAAMPSAAAAAGSASAAGAAGGRFKQSADGRKRSATAASLNVAADGEAAADLPRSKRACTARCEQQQYISAAYAAAAGQPADEDMDADGEEEEEANVSFRRRIRKKTASHNASVAATSATAARHTEAPILPPLQQEQEVQPDSEASGQAALPLHAAVSILPEQTKKVAPAAAAAAAAGGGASFIPPAGPVLSQPAGSRAAAAASTAAAEAPSVAVAARAAAAGDNTAPPAVNAGEMRLLSVSELRILPAAELQRFQRDLARAREHAELHMRILDLDFSAERVKRMLHNKMQ